MASGIPFTEEYYRDLFELASGRRLPQFVNGEVRCGILNAEVRQTQDLFDALFALLEGRTVAGARAAQLDVIGRIVGQPRILLNQAVIAWFTPDTIAGTPDTTPAWCFGAPVFGDLPANDEQFSQLIAAKIFKNHTIHGSIPEVLQFVKLVYDINISIRKYGQGDIALIVPTNTPLNVVTTLVSFSTTVRTDNAYFLPLSPVARFIDVIYRPGLPFAPDRHSGAPDAGLMSVGVPL